MNVRALLPVCLLLCSAACSNARRENASTPAPAPAPANGGGGLTAPGPSNPLPGMPFAPAPAPTANAPALPADWDRSLCERMQRMCGGEGAEFQVSQCMQQAGELRRNVSPRLALETSSCVEQSETCAAAAGCITGGALRGVGGQFLVGFGNALSR